MRAVTPEIPEHKARTVDARRTGVEGLDASDTGFDRRLTSKHLSLHAPAPCIQSAAGVSFAGRSKGIPVPQTRLFTAKQGQTVFKPGQDCPGFLDLKKGAIRVMLTGASGREVVLYRVRPGEVCLQTFSCLVDGHAYGAEGIVEADIEADLIPASQFRQQLEDDPAFRQKVLSSVALRFSEYQQLVEDVALTAFDARLAKALLRLADDSGIVHATHSALAAETASGRAYVTRRLAVFAKKGIVEQLPDGIAIREKRALEQIAADPR